MRTGSRLVIVLLALGSFAGPGLSWSAAKNDWPMEAFEPDLTDLPSLQNGFKLYASSVLHWINEDCS